MHERSQQQLIDRPFRRVHVGLDIIQIHRFARAVLRHVADRSGKRLQHGRFDVLSNQPVHKLERSGGVTHVLHWFEAGHVVEKPCAACVGEQRIFLRFQQPQRQRLFLVVERVRSVAIQKRPNRIFRRIEKAFDIVVARRPRIMQERLALLLKHVCQRIAQTVKAFPQRRAPFLIPSGGAVHRAAAIPIPAPHAVRATP